VILHDLQTDILPEQWLVPDVLLPAIVPFKKHTYYERSTSGYGEHGGNLQHEKTWEDLAALSPIDACIVYDILIESTERLIWLIGQMIRHFPGCPLVTRWILPLDMACQLISVFQASFRSTEVYIVYFERQGIEVVIRTELGHSDFLRPYTSKVELASIFQYHIDTEGLDVYGGGREENWLMEFGELDVEIGDEEHLLAQSGQSLVDDAMRRSIHGYSYGQWTRVMWYKFASELKVSGDNLEDMYIRAYCDGVAHITLRERRIALATTRAFKDFISRSLPRCI
jgi:hypothetical protein